MWVVIFTSIIAIILCYLSKFKGCHRLFEWAFLLVTILAAIHYDYGTDYMTYYDLWQGYRNINVKDLLSDFYGQSDWNEPGWMLLNAIFGFNNGFFVLVAILNIIQNYIFYKLIKNNVPRNWYWFAMFLYLCMDNLYLVNFSMMRQGLAVALFVAAAMMMANKKYFFAFLTVFLATTVHLSSVICFPLLLLYFLPIHNSRVLGISFIFIALFLFIFLSYTADLFNAVTSLESLEKYGGQRETLDKIGLGYVINHIPNFVILYALLTNKYLYNDREKYIAVLAFCDIFITPLQFVAGDIAGRLGVYFLAFKVPVIPLLCSRFHDKAWRVIFVVFTLVITLYAYYNFFNAWFYVKSYGGPFHTIFSVI